MRVKALLLAGGVGERLRPLTETTPKCLVPIGGKPLLDYWVEALLAANILQACINTHHLAEQVRHSIARINAGGALQVVETHEPRLLGSAGTLTSVRELAADADAILVVYTDNLSDVRLAEFLRFHQSHNLPGSLLLFRAPRPEACGIVTLDDAATVIDFIEKPQAPVSDLANAGLYLFDAQLFREIADMAAFDLGKHVLPRLRGRMKGYVHQGYHRDIGTPEALAQAHGDLLGGKVFAA